jgi:hypothetical protein
MAALLYAWIEAVQRRAALVALIAAVCVCGVAYYTAGHLNLDTNSSDMISKDLPWRRAGAELDRLFPQQSQELVVVIDGRTPEQAEQAQRSLVHLLRQHPDRFNAVFAMDTEPYFRRNGLLFLDEAQLRSVADSLTRAQPFLGTLMTDPSLHGLFTLLERAVSSGGAQDFDLKPALTQISDSVSAATDGRSEPLSWTKLTGQDDSALGTGTRRFIEVNPKLQYDQMLPAAAAIDTIRGIARDQQMDSLHGLSVRLTGNVALEHE